MKATDIVLLGVDVILTVMVISIARYSYDTLSNIEKVKMDTSMTYFNDLTTAEAYEYHKKSMSGINAKNVIRRYKDKYAFRIRDPMTNEEGDSLDLIENTAEYYCTFMAADNDGYVEAEDLNKSSFILFTRTSELPTYEQLDFSGIITLVNGTSGTINQEMLDTLYDYVIALKKENDQFSQRNVYKTDLSEVLGNSRVKLSVVPTDLIIWVEGGQSVYLDLSASAYTGMDSIETSLDGVSVLLTHGADGSIESCEIENKQTQIVHVKAFRALAN